MESHVVVHDLLCTSCMSDVLGKTSKFQIKAIYARPDKRHLMACSAHIPPLC